MLEKLVKESKALEKAIAGEELSYDDGMELMSYDNLYMLGAAADMVREQRVGASSYICGIILHELHKRLCCKLPDVCIL